jgi:FkbM family methyltransferase
MAERSKSRTYTRFRWSHRSQLHRRAVRVYNAVMATVPFSVKYRLGKRARRRRPPYCYVRPGSVVVQVGAPQDTLLAGRSRAMHFALLAGPTGKVLAVEPDAVSAQRLEETAASHGVNQLIVHQGAAWSEATTLVMYIDDRHPATNFTGGCADYSEGEMASFRRCELPARPLDDILADHAVGAVDLISITTNGAEQEILAGLTATIARGVAYVCLARTSELASFAPTLSELGYEFLSHDDRGYTFHRSAAGSSGD